MLPSERPEIATTLLAFDRCGSLAQHNYRDPGPYPHHSSRSEAMYRPPARRTGRQTQNVTGAHEMTVRRGEASEAEDGLPDLIVDSHVHVFRKLSSRYPRHVHELYPEHLEARVEHLLDVMGANGVSKAVLVPLSHHDEYVRECLTQFPGRFAGIGFHDRTSTGSADNLVKDFRRRVAETGIQGLRFFHLGDPRVEDARNLPLFPLLREMASNNHKVWFYAPPDQLAVLRRVLEALPGLHVVLNHLGFCPGKFGMDNLGRPRHTIVIPPPTLSGVLGLSDFANVRVMVSGEYSFSRDRYPYRDVSKVVREIYLAFGSTRLLWASDFPWIVEEPGYASVASLPRAHLPDLTSRELEAIMAGNAMDLFFAPV